MIRNFVEMVGEKVGNIYVFFMVEKIVFLFFDEFKRVKFGYCVEYIKYVMEFYLKGELKFDLWEMDEKEVIKYFMVFCGIGKWIVEFFFVYGLRKNIYLVGDFGLRRGIVKIFGKSVKEVKEKDVREIFELYGKWKGLLVFYIICYDRKIELERRRIK